MNLQKQMKMAGNKYDTPFAIHKPKFYRLEFEDLYGETQAMTGTTKQVLNYILNQQLQGVTGKCKQSSRISTLFVNGGSTPPTSTKQGKVRKAVDN